MVNSRTRQLSNTKSQLANETIHTFRR